MKKICCFLIFIAAFLTSCNMFNKDKATVVSNEEVLIGSWYHKLFEQELTFMANHEYYYYKNIVKKGEKPEITDGGTWSFKDGTIYFEQDENYVGKEEYMNGYLVIPDKRKSYSHKACIYKGNVLLLGDFPDKLDSKTKKSMEVNTYEELLRKVGFERMK